MEFHREHFTYLRNHYDATPLGRLRQRQEAMAEAFLRYDERLTSARTRTAALERIIRKFPMQRPFMELLDRANQSGRMPSGLAGWTAHVVGSKAYNMLKARGEEPRTNLIIFKDPRYIHRPESFVLETLERSDRLSRQILRLQDQMRFQMIDALDPQPPEFLSTTKVQGYTYKRRWWRMFLPQSFWRGKAKLGLTLAHYYLTWRWVARWQKLARWRDNFQQWMYFRRGGGYTGYMHAWKESEDIDRKLRARTRLMVYGGFMPASFRKQYPTAYDNLHSFWSLKYLEPYKLMATRFLDYWFLDQKTVRPGRLAFLGFATYVFAAFGYYGYHHKELLASRDNQRGKQLDMSGFDSVEKKETEFEYRYSRGSFNLPKL